MDYALEKYGEQFLVVYRGKFRSESDFDAFKASFTPGLHRRIFGWVSAELFNNPLGI